MSVSGMLFVLVCFVSTVIHIQPFIPLGLLLLLLCFQCEVDFPSFGQLPFLGCAGTAAEGRSDIALDICVRLDICFNKGGGGKKPYF